VANCRRRRAPPDDVTTYALRTRLPLHRRRDDVRATGIVPVQASAANAAHRAPSRCSLARVTKRIVRSPASTTPRRRVREPCCGVGRRDVWSASFGSIQTALRRRAALAGLRPRRSLATPARPAV